MKEKDFRNICELARIQYEEHMFDGFKAALGVINHVLDFNEELDVNYNINTPESKPEADKPVEGLSNEEALLNTDKKKYGYFVINKYVGE